MFSKTSALRCLLLASAIASLVGTGAVNAAGDSAFTECSACHSTDGSNGLGPSLKGIVGRKSASAPGFAYSAAMKRAQLTWTPAELDKYITNPQNAIPGNAMPYAGMADANQRKALIAYLQTLK
jgi:cytochrome c